MNVLATGAAGFSGSCLVDALLRRGDRVVGLDSFNAQYDPRRKRRHLAAGLEEQLAWIREEEPAAGTAGGNSHG